jgi:flagellar motor switch protein FliN
MTTLTHELDLPALEPTGDGAALFGTAPLPFLKSVKVRVSVRVGETETSVSELLALKVGGTLTLNRLVDQPLDILVDDHIVARGTLVAVGDHFGVRLTEPPVSASAKA